MLAAQSPQQESVFASSAASRYHSLVRLEVMEVLFTFMTVPLSRDRLYPPHRTCATLRDSAKEVLEVTKLYAAFNGGNHSRRTVARVKQNATGEKNNSEQVALTRGLASE